MAITAQPNPLPDFSGLVNSHSDAARDRTSPLKDSIPLDRYIQNYDSAYHIIFTNVKTIQQFGPPNGREPAASEQRR
jgi:hypothetical protein